MNSTEKEYIFGLIYGASGTGKTHLIGTLGELGTVLVIDVDKGYKTIKYSPDLQQYRENVTIVSFDMFKDLDSAYKLIDKNDPVAWTKAFDPTGKLGFKVTKPYDWIVWDTWSELQWSMIQELRSKKGLLGSGINFRDNKQIQHWGSMTDLNKLAIEQLRECKVNQIFTMQEKMDKDEVTGAIFGGPAIHGKLVQEMPTYFDVVVHTTVDPAGNFIAATKPKGKWPAKTRIGVLGEYKNPKASDIFKQA